MKKIMNKISLILTLVSLASSVAFANDGTNRGTPATETRLNVVCTSDPSSLSYAKCIQSMKAQGYFDVIGCIESNAGNMFCEAAAKMYNMRLVKRIESDGWRDVQGSRHCKIGEGYIISDRSFLSGTMEYKDGEIVDVTVATSHDKCWGESVF